METFAVRRPFPCWICGGPTIKMRDTYTRWCSVCDVQELKVKRGYTLLGRNFERFSPEGIPYLDHSEGYYPCP